MWKYYALLSAFFAALTAIFAKIGVKDVNSDLATAIRTAVIIERRYGGYAGQLRLPLYAHQESQVETGPSGRNGSSSEHLWNGV